MLRSACTGVAVLSRANAGAGVVNALFGVPVRYKRAFRYPKVTYLPFEWDYPKKKNPLTLSGDRTMDYGFREELLNRPKLAFAKLPELEKAPEEMKKIFSIGFATKKEQRDSIKDEFLNLVRRHPYDKSSLEYKIAQRTFNLRSFNEYLTTNNFRDRRMKAKLLETMAGRNKLLNRLYRLDEERYNFLKEVLQIDYTPAPLHRCPPKHSRKGTLRQMTAEYAEKMKAEKMQAYHDKLKQFQKEFEVEKREAEEWIAKEIADLKLTDAEIQSLEYKGKILK
ncbi:28S ribosomal protein S15 [Tropilaelaps mercedesae]|uniref:Small ribosomal subunit protein uS15m n=1 Tax=Tropilaelaps mercedesae TaxID=418985 RepID=A0A1V9X511_9ACAR|nr:28S ribosomal protein S15 [Tropilaelaps mercedesae]